MQSYGLLAALVELLGCGGVQAIPIGPELFHRHVPDRSRIKLLEGRSLLQWPEPQEGKPPGTVHIATCARGEEPIAEHHRFSGDPVEVMERSIVTALAALIARISG